MYYYQQQLHQSNIHQLYLVSHLSFLPGTVVAMEGCGGVGLFLGYLMSNYVFHMQDDNPVMYFSLMGIFWGLGLITSYWIEKKQTLDKE